MKPLEDYSFIKGVCYYCNGEHDGNIEKMEREFGYAQRIGINSVRTWLEQKPYKENPAQYAENLRTFIRIGWKHGISTMPILWNGNFLDRQLYTLDEANWPEMDEYVKTIVEAVKDEPGLIMWDIMNEPTCNKYFREATPEEKAQRLPAMNRFLKHYCDLVRELDPVNAITIGNFEVLDLEPGAAWVDCVSFHDYSTTRKGTEDNYKTARAVCEKYGKPLINNETACICRGNPYDVAVQMAEKYHAGWYLFELMIHGYWGPVHGIFYEDGTVRDPSLVAAVQGFYRKRDFEGRVNPELNAENHAIRAIEQTEKVLRSRPKPVFFKRPGDPDYTDELLEAAEYCANLLEAGEMVPMYEPPTIKILHWRSMEPEKRPMAEIRAFAYELMNTLKQVCQL